MSVEDQYIDVLQNIEFSIVTFYRQQHDLSDYDVTRTLEALVDHYAAEKIGRPPRHFSLSDQECRLFDGVKKMCEWRLGRISLDDAVAQAEEKVLEPNTVDEIILCLKKILKSVNKCHNRGGRQGYLNFVSEFIP